VRGFPLSWLKRRLQLRPPAHGSPPSTFVRVAYCAPRQVVLVTARHDGVDNVWPIDWHVPLSLEPELYGITGTRSGFGTGVIRASGTFVVNFVPAAWEELILLCGRTSGRDTDKFASTGLLKEEAESIDAPRLKDALGCLECRVEQTIEVGDHTLFVGRVHQAVYRANAPRLHHLDGGLATLADTFQ
jgi:flavin reductase (DIM6/NTAB) family NADH-FMN oxidoreductase RutF